MTMLAALDPVIIIAIVAIAVAVLALTANLIIMARYKKKQKAEPPKYTLTEAAEKIEIMRRGELLVMARNVTYSVGDEGEIAEGSYQITCAVDGDTKLNLRVNGLVREYDSGVTVTLGAGDTICCVSGSALMKRV